MGKQEYLVLIIEAPWHPGDFTPEAIEKEWPRHRAFMQAVKDAGQEITASNALDAASEAVRIDPATDTAAAVFTDAPFGEVKELVSGYYQFTADSREQALELAALCPTNGHLDVFPIIELS